MSSKSLILPAVILLVIFGFVATTAPAFAASKEKVLYRFCSQSGCIDGDGPGGSVIFDAAGNLYGTAEAGGAQNSGVVFKLTPEGKETVLYSFCAQTSCIDGIEPTRDGIEPTGSLIFDAAGNLYGVTYEGGAYGGAYGGGSVFELTPATDGSWTEQLLHSFGSGNDGSQPSAGLILDVAGNLYGTTIGGGAYSGCFSTIDGCGTVFELTPGKNGQWTEKVLYNFGQNARDGFGPEGSLVIDDAGNLYGTTIYGGAYSCSGSDGCGTVFELMPGKNGRWKGRVIHSFNGNDGDLPVSNVIFDSAGNLYGTTYEGGYRGWGTVFKLVPSKNGEWREELLHSFRNQKSPDAGVILDPAGNLYGTSFLGGPSGSGTVFELTPDANGKWTETVLQKFDKADGQWPRGSLTFDSAGNLYGTTGAGGRIHDRSCYSQGCGTVFEITP
jgi:uncharacterized repeat protein (TIGR03803 family)